MQKVLLEAMQGQTGTGALLKAQMGIYCVQMLCYLYVSGLSQELDHKSDHDIAFTVKEV